MHFLEAFLKRRKSNLVPLETNCSLENGLAILVSIIGFVNCAADGILYSRPLVTCVFWAERSKYNL